ncbi:MAG: DUF4114 domain-containing protein [Hyphomicrobiaceae bacterium]
MSDLIGTPKDDVIVGGSGDEFIAGEGKNDVITGGDGDDTILGGSGDDTIGGEGGDDNIFGGAKMGGEADLSRFKIAEDVDARVTFLGDGAGFQNTIGMYKIGADGSIYDVEILFDNASLKNSGGDLLAGKSSTDVSLKAGDRIGFFMLPNAYAQSKSNQKLLGDDDGRFVFLDAAGKPGNANDTSALSLYYVDGKGRMTQITSEYAHAKNQYTSFHGDSDLNADGVKHLVGMVDVKTGTVKISFEDLWSGGDKDYDDVVISIDVGTTNAALLPRMPSGNGTSTDDDVIDGGDGNDELYGMQGHDYVAGGNGDDRIWGNSGNDVLDGGDGDDDVRGGIGNDEVYGGAGDDHLEGNTGDDLLSGGDGNDTLAGNSGNDVIADGAGHDTADAGSGDDVFIAGEGDDSYDGGSGFDTIDFSDAGRGIVADLNNHTVTGMGSDRIWSVEKVIGTAFDDTFRGDKKDNVFEGGSGDDSFRGLGGADTFTGEAGKDTYVWYAKDVVDTKGNHLGVDTITDFSDEDVLNLHEFLKGMKYDSIEDVVTLKDGDEGTMVSVKVGGDFVDVVMLEGWHGHTAQDMLSSGMIMA